MRLLYSGLNGSGYDLNSRIHGCPVEEHSLVGDRLPEISKKKKCRPPLVAIKGAGVYFGEESSMRLLYSGLNGSGYD